MLSLIGVLLLLFAGAESVQTALSLEGSIVVECGPEGSTPQVSYLPMLMQIFGASATGILLNYDSSYVKRVSGKFPGKDLKRLFLGLVVSGGSVYDRDGKYCIRFYGKDYTLHQVFSGLSYELYRSTPKTLYIPGRNTYMTQLYCKDAVVEIKELSPETDQRKGGIPTISYILEGDRSVRQESFRVIMSVSGWVNPAIKEASYRCSVYPRLGLGSSVPISLNEEYRTLAKSVSLDFKSYAEKRYKGKSYLMTHGVETCRRFLEIGGFLEGNAVKKGKYAGKEKNALLKTIVALSDRNFKSADDARMGINAALCNSNFELSALLGRIMLG